LGIDYTSSAPGVVIPAGNLAGNITLTSLDDNEAEEDEAVDVFIDSLVNAVNSAPTNVTIAITSDDPAVSNADGASDVSFATATLNGVLEMGDFADARFYYGLIDEGTNAAAWAATTTVQAVAEDVEFSAAVSNLSPSFTYYYRAFASNGSSLGSAWAASSSNFTSQLSEISVLDVTVVEGDSGSVDAVITVGISAASHTNVTVQYATADGEALAGLDYQATSGTATILAGAISTEITIPVIGDTELEFPNETFLLDLSNPTNALFGDNQAVVTISDDDASGHLASWAYRMKITFCGYDQPGTLTNFPALVDLGTHRAGFAYDQFASSVGGDLRFANADQSQLLAHEVEEWNTNGTSAVWVRVPELTGTDTCIWAYWGNAAMTEPLPSTTNGMVWSEGFEGVWHFSGNANDSANANHGTLIGDASFSSLSVVGQALHLDGVGDFVDIVDNAADFSGGITVEGWARPEAYRNWSRIIDWANGAGVDNILLARRGTTQNGWRWEFHDTAGGTETHDVNRAIPLNQFTYRAATVEGGGVNSSRSLIYADGTEIARKLDSTPPRTVNRVNNYFGESNWGGDDFFEGVMDEIRISTVERAPNWLRATWMNAAMNNVFNCYDPVVNPGGDDFDGDGIPDAIDPDDDNDGMSDEDEMIAGTDSLDETSFLYLLIENTLTPDTRTLIFPSVNGRDYFIRSRLDLGSGVWSPPGPAIPGDGSLKLIPDGTPEIRMYYQLGVELSPP
jgi:hypothetical protein